MFGADAPDFGAASDGDGDRNMIVGRHFVVTPSDSLAILAANAHLVPGYADGLERHRALDADQRAPPTASPQALGIACYETPTGWKFFGNLLDAGLVDAVRRGERRHRLRPRAREGRPVGGAVLAQHPRRARRVGRAIVRDHWRRFGRNFYSRHDYEGVDSAAAQRADDAPARDRWRRCRARARRRRRRDCDRAAPTTSPTPIRSTARSAPRQGIRIVFDDGSRIVFRLSGTGTEGATLRVYLERFEPDPRAPARGETQALLAPLIALAERIVAHPRTHRPHARRR